MQILVVEDDQTLLDGITLALEQEKWFVQKSVSGDDAWFLGSTESYDAVVLDLSLPKLDGLEILQKWRADDVATPVLILTARSSWIERVKGINLGADDYLPKPFKMEELIARLRAIIRRSRGHSDDVISCRDVTINLLDKSVKVKGRVLELGLLEWRALSHLMLNLDVAIPSYELIEHVYGQHSKRNANAIEALIKRLRKKIDVPLIHTQRGAGYVIKPEEKMS